MGTMTFEQFEAATRAQGFDEVVERDWAPGLELQTHTHPFAVHALVWRGEFWLTAGGETRHLRAGETFDLGREAPHAERYGADGATFWVARRHSTGTTRSS
jgi:quercetin dioxygenase-like cupin family protein